MKTKIQLLIIMLGFCVIETQAHVGPNHGAPTPGTSNSQTASYRMDCAQATQAYDMDINNVRARLLNGGDVWWDGNSNGRYVVPKVDPASGVPEVSSLFAGAVWLGGLDPGGNLKVACQQFGSSTGATDFWPGPLTEIGVTSTDTCADWDKFFTVFGEEIDNHLTMFEDALSNDLEYDPDLIPLGVKGWPAKGNQFFFDIHQFELPDAVQGLAPFFDQDGDSEYHPERGDYPIIQVRGCNMPNYADEMTFWIYNDAGGLHTETNGDAIRMEVQVQAFAFATNDEINNMTFQRYKLINRAIESIDSTFFGMWVDPDLGCYLDDYIGCDTSRSMAYVYNQDALDGEASCNDCGQGVATYCDRIPLLGVDYFRGPLDENLNELGMSSFTYFIGQGAPTTAQGDPTVAAEYYNYLSGSWRDGTSFTNGGDGYNPASTDFTDYAFPSAPNDQNGWSMCSEGVPSGDRRTVQASGPFKLQPGAVNELIVGVVWVPEGDYPCPDITDLQSADDVAQILFDNCFKLKEGPAAPDADWIELDEEVIAVLSNNRFNNINESFRVCEECPSLPVELHEDFYYNFEGYKIYQLADANVSVTELENPDRARIVKQMDIQNDVSIIHNWSAIDNPNPDPTVPRDLWFPNEEVDGENKGISHTFKITEDQFSGGPLVNHKKYYYMTLAYAHNEYEAFAQVNGNISGRRDPYLPGRKNIKTYTVIPRPIVDEKLNSVYGDGAIITRLAGIGVGSNSLDISEETRTAIMDGSFDGTIVYEPGRGPIDIKIYNPLEAKDGEFEIKLIDDDLSDDLLDNEGRWQLKDLSNNEVYESIKSLDEKYEQIFPEFGLSIDISQTLDAGAQVDASNGLIDMIFEYENPNELPWLLTVPDDDGPFNYIKTGTGEEDNNLDPESAYSSIDGSSFVPYTLTDFRSTPLDEFIISPAWDHNTNSNIVRARNLIENLNNVDIVFTSDKELWSRCVVVETATKKYTDANIGLGLESEGNAANFDLRQAPSVTRFDKDKDGLADVDTDDNGVGMGWFPGYAIDVETGKRLNIFFGENSTYDGSAFPEAYEDTPNGRDMMWNPTSQVFLEGPNFSVQNFLLGGQHYIYVSSTEYDECATIREQLSGNDFQKVIALQDVTWTSMPVMTQGQSLSSYDEGLIKNELVVKLRVENPYAVERGVLADSDYPTYLFSLEGVQAEQLTTENEFEDQLANIRAVPNPYYGYSAYETSQFTNIIKITNLPAKCTVSIFTLDGKFIRQYARNEQEVDRLAGRTYAGIASQQIVPDLEWDLNNSKGIPVASGVYLIHVDAPGIGERTIKWFGVHRQFDPSGL